MSLAPSLLPRYRSKLPLLSVLLLVLLGVSLFAVTAGIEYTQNYSSQAADTNQLTVNASVPVHAFSRGMLGMAFVNWEHSWNKPYLDKVPGLTSALQAAGTGVIRYAGGNWANYVGFDATKKTPTPYVDWQHNGMTYSFNYGTDEITAVQRFAKAIDADVIVQVNISNNDPDMWAAMVKFTNFGTDPVTGQPKKPIKYWELGNELDMACNGGDSKVCVQPAEYASRAVVYQQKMLAQDPTIKFLGAGQATAVQATGTNANLSQYFFTPLQATKNAGHTMDGVTYHWYMECGANSLSDIMRYRFYNSDGSALNPATLWNNNYSRFWADALPTALKSQVLAQYPNTLLGITEMNFNACNYDSVFNGNHANALWFSDTLGRLAYSGLDFSTAYTGYGIQGYGLLYPDNDDNPTKIMARPSYNAFVMYNKYFGDQMVQSGSYKNDDISIWASTDSDDPGKLKLRITNMTGSNITVPVALTGFSANGGSVYVLKSTNPTDAGSTSNLQAAPSTINGVKLDPMNISTTLANVQPSPLAASGSSFTYTFPAYSSTAIILNGAGGGAPSPIPSIWPTPSVAPSPSTSPIPSPLPTPPSSPVPSIWPSPSATPKASPSPVPSGSPIPSIWPSPSPVPTPVPSPVPTPVPSVVPSPIASAAPSPTPTPTPTIVPTPVPSPSPVPIAPAITSIKVSSVTNSSALVSWTTNVPTRGTVEYVSGWWSLFKFWRKTSSKTPMEINFSLIHAAQLNDLPKHTTIWYRVHAYDIKGKEAVSKYHKFTTAK